MSNTVPSEYYWWTRNADANHQNTISGREDHQSPTQCRQNTIGGRAVPTPIIRILLAGGKTAKAEHSAIRILLAGAQCHTSHQNTISGREDHQRGTQCHQNTISGREDHPSGTLCNQNTISGRRGDDSRTQCHQNTISGREDNQRGTQCHQNTISGRKDRGPLRLGLTKLLTSGRRGLSMPDSVVHP